MIERNDRGQALLLMIFSLLVVVLTINSLVGGLMDSLSDDLNRQRRAIAGYLAMRDFAIMAQKANLAFVTNPVAGNCPAGTTPGPIPGTSPFCWPDGVVGNQHCIQHPLYITAPVLLCLNGVNPARLEVVVKDLRSWPERTMETGREYVASVGEELGRQIRSLAFAQAFDNHRPALTGAPTNNLPDPGGQMTCTGLIGGTLNCKRCTPNPTAPNLSCVTLRVCLSARPCQANEWLTQAVGILDR